MEGLPQHGWSAGSSWDRPIPPSAHASLFSGLHAPVPIVRTPEIAPARAPPKGHPPAAIGEAALLPVVAPGSMASQKYFYLEYVMAADLYMRGQARLLPVIRTPREEPSFYPLTCIPHPEYETPSLVFYYLGTEKTGYGIPCVAGAHIGTCVIALSASNSDRANINALYVISSITGIRIFNYGRLGPGLIRFMVPDAACRDALINDWNGAFAFRDFHLIVAKTEGGKEELLAISALPLYYSDPKGCMLFVVPAEGQRRT